MGASRQAWLDALGIEVWVPRERAPATPQPPDVSAETSSARPADETPTETTRPIPPQTISTETPDARPGVVAGPGAGSCLYLCAATDDTSGPLASDLARVLSAPPVWARLGDSGDTGEPLEALIAERLFTQVVVFGEGAAGLLFGAEVPEQCGPARVTVAPSLARLAEDPRARRHCWFTLKSSGCLPRS